MNCDNELILKVSNMYYENNYSQDLIANKLYISRSKISRILTEARKKELVEIIVHNTVGRNSFLEKAFAKRFGLKKIIIAKSNMNSDFDNVIELAYQYFDLIVKENTTVGISRGKTMLAFSKKFTQHRDLTVNVVQLLGALSQVGCSYEEFEIATQLCSGYNGTCHYLLSPFFCKSNLALMAFEQIDINKDAINYAHKANIIVGSVGDITEERIKNVWKDCISPNEIEKLYKNKIVGVFCGNFYDIDGNLLDMYFTKRIVGIPISEISAKEDTICIASGKNKVDAIVGSINGNLFNTLITDENTALEILMHPELKKK